MLTKKTITTKAAKGVSQALFLPMFQQAETRIKELIVASFWNKATKLELESKIKGVVDWLELNVPEQVMNRSVYIDGIIKKANFLIKAYYQREMFYFYETTKTFFQQLPKGYKLEFKNIETPKDLFQAAEQISKSPMWQQAKGSVRVANYPEKVKEFINNLSKEPITTYEKGKKPINLWQKAELDIRYNNQMEQLDKLKSENVEYAWISSHPDCSKRCEKFQGKLVSLKKHAENPQKIVRKSDYSDLRVESYRVEKLNGYWVYSLPDIMATETPGGYNNMIYCGFNCRHHLIPYIEGIKPTNEYSKKQVAKQREIEQRIRAMEREIRLLKTKRKNYNVIGNSGKKEVAELTKKINERIRIYKEYCRVNGYAWYQYRINV